MALPKLSVKGVTCKFGNNIALEDVSLDIQPKEFVCVVGASGCGKSTLFNAVSGLLKPTSGKIFLDEADITGKPRHVGYMLQKDLLLPWRTVLENIVLGASLTRGAKDADYQIAAEFARRYGLGQFLDTYPAALSGGMRQRVALMRTLAAGRDLMLLDEPFGALDYQTRLAMQQWLLDVWRDMQRTVMFVTHDVDEAVFLADRVVVMTPRPGRISKILTIDLPRPRTMDTVTMPEFVARKREIIDLLHHHHVPTKEAAA